MTDTTTQAALPEPVGFRTRYRSDPGMIGHYPWTYADQRRRGVDRPEFKSEDLFTADQMRQALASLTAERDELQAQVEALRASITPISVKDRLPAKNTEVFVFFAGQGCTLWTTGQYTGSQYDKHGWCYPAENNGSTSTGDDPVVTHWLPMEALPIPADTRCWACGESYDITSAKCPSCESWNGTLHPDKAMAEAAQQEDATYTAIAKDLGYEGPHDIARKEG